MRFPAFIGPSYTSQSVNVDCQNCVNFYPELNELGTGKEREPASLVPTPGKRLLLTLANGPVRGMLRASNDQLFVVSGTKFYTISSNFVATELGTLSTSSGAVSIDDNGTYVFIVDGTYGYTWSIPGATFTQVTDPNFYPSDTVAFQDGYFIFIKKGSQQFFISGLNDITFDALDVSSAEGSPDYLVGGISANQILYLFGNQSIEAFYNSGNADFPFERIQGAVNDVGCYAVQTIAKLHGSPYFLGGDSTGCGVIYRMQGYQAVRISTPAIESVIRGLDQTTLANSRAWVYQQGGHSFYCINFPGASSTWVYDASTSLWHERQFLNLWSLERDRADCHAVAFGLNIVGDYVNGNVYALDPNTYTDNGTSIARIRTAPHSSSGLNFIRHNSFQLDMEVGIGTNSGQGLNPKVILSWSDDGGHSWSNEYQADAGKIGNYKARVIWRRLGMSRDRVYRVKITDPVKVVLIGAEVNLDEGRS